MNESNSTDIESIMLAEAREDVVKADHKASLVLASLGIGFGAILGGILAGDWKPTQLSGAGEIIWWVGACLVGLAVLCAGWAVWPRYDAGDASAGIYYWAHVASFASLSSFTAALEADMPRPVDRTRNQLWSVSRIVRAKYALIRSAMALTLIAILAFLLSLIVSAAAS